MTSNSQASMSGGDGWVVGRGPSIRMRLRRRRWLTFIVCFEMDERWLCDRRLSHACLSKNNEGDDSYWGCCMKADVGTIPSR